MPVTNKAPLLKLAGLVCGAALLIGVNAGAGAAPLSVSRQGIEAARPDDAVVEAVTRAGVAHRSARRTDRRVMRR